MTTSRLPHPFTITRRALVLLAALALPLAASSGCAGQSRETYMREHAGDYTYDKPMAEVWAAAKQLLSDEGYSGREVRGGWIYVTEWKESGTQSAISSTATRYLIEGKELSPSRCSVKYTKVTRSSGASPTGGTQYSDTHGGMANINPSEDPVHMPAASGTEGIGQKETIASGQRDLEMEWKLLQRVDPKAASAIEGQAKREYPDD